jgi:pyridinium-3,5-bisthiocarboxylic acid mononucleotide nickel chelatase
MTPVRALIFEPFSGIAGDMCLGALVDLGLERDWLLALPGHLELDGVTARVERVLRGGIQCQKVDFDIPPQPHGRHLRHIEKILERPVLPERVRGRSLEVFRAIGLVEAAIHGTTIERVHFHEVGAVDAILDIVGTIWGLELLGVQEVYNTPLTLGDGFVEAAHGVLPVPAPATLRLLEGIEVRPGPPDSGELVTPTGAALVRVLSRGRPPASFRPVRSGYGAGTRDPSGRPNALRATLVEVSHASVEAQPLVMLAADVDDMSPEYLAAAAHALRDAGALDVIMLPAVMKKGRPGTRIEVLTVPENSGMLRSLLFQHTSTLGVREHEVLRHALARHQIAVLVEGREIRIKVAVRPDGSRHLKPEFDDVHAVARALGRSAQDVSAEALHAAQHALKGHS